MPKTSVLESSEEKSNGFKLMRLIVDGGTEALRKTFTKYHPGNLETVLNTHQPSLLTLKHQGFLDREQWEKLYPSSNPPNIDEWDISLLAVLLRNICGLLPPTSVIWSNKPDVSVKSVEADIVRIRLFRNKRFAHIPNTSVSSADFEALWTEISFPLVRLKIDQKEIDRLENELVRSECVLNKNLASFDFQEEIERYNRKFTEGTRVWVFDQVKTWFDDENSSNRAFIISGDPGMGKTIIAAVVCEKLAEHVGASHFFQHNNSLYSNSKFFLQSLAAQLCKIVPKYREILVEKLSGNLGQSLNDMNTEGLFTFLFKEPFSCISNPEKRILIILDAVDEAELDGRDELGSLISKHLPELPSYLRFLVTTRQEKNLIEKFKKFNPLCIKHDDERNLDDIKLLLEHTIAKAHASSLDSLAEKCDGLMLYAFLLSEMYKEESSKASIDSLPERIEEYYEIIFKRLGRELGHLKVSGEKFQSFLNVIAVAKEPLPEAFLETIFDFKNLPDTRQKVRRAVNSLSTVFVINENKYISFLHKSVRDWLVGNAEHDYSVNVQYGHETLLELCVKELDKLKVRGVTEDVLSGVAMQYTLKYFIPHMLNIPEMSVKPECFYIKYVSDLEVLFASVHLNVDLTLNNLTNLKNSKLYSNISEETKANVSQLCLLIRKFAFFLRDYPHGIFQTVVNEGGEELSFRASTLLKERYKDIMFLEFVEKESNNDAHVAQWFLSGTLSGIDVSRNNDYVVCSYKKGGIELFSLTTGKSEWKKGNFRICATFLPSYDYSLCKLNHCIVFHPRENLIFPGNLIQVLNLQGEFTTGPFRCDENFSKFSNCCFSSDGSKMATYHHIYDDDKLIVWNVSSGNIEKTIQCETLLSFSFTASGNFFGTTDTENIFNVYDVVNDYNDVKSEQSISKKHPIEIVTTCDQDSWFCVSDRRLASVSHCLESQASPCSIEDIYIPNNYFASNEIKQFLENREQSWFSKISKSLLTHFNFEWDPYIAIRYILIGDKNVLIYSCSSIAMFVFNIDRLVNMERQVELDPEENVYSSMSLDGSFAYCAAERKHRLTVSNLASKVKWRPLKPYLKGVRHHFAVVRGGVILLAPNGTPELWNNDVTKRLFRFSLLAGIWRCFSVSDALIACESLSSIKFFNVFTKEILSETFVHKTWIIIAVSVQYHVLLKISGNFFLKKGGVRLDGWKDVFHTNTNTPYSVGQRLVSAVFSPQGDRLAWLRFDTNEIKIYNVSSINLLTRIPTFGPGNTNMLNFFYNEFLLLSTYNGMLVAINTERGKVSTLLAVGDYPSRVAVSREKDIVFYAFISTERYKLIKIWLPRKRTEIV